MIFSAPSSLHRVLARLVLLLACRMPASPARAESPVIAAGSQANEAVTAAVQENHGRVPAFRDDDRICFLGDSITAGGWYHEYLQLFYSTRFPDRNIECWNCGVGGDTATAVVQEGGFRIQRDILDRHPTIVAVMLGMNDIESGLYESGKRADDLDAQRHAALHRYRASMQSLLTTLRHSGVRIILLTPSIFDDTAVRTSGPTFAGANDALKACANWVRDWGQEFDADVVDVHGLMDAINLSEQVKNPSFTIHGVGQKTWKDPIHPGPGAHLIIAYAVLKAQRLEGKVSDVVIDAASARVVVEENARVSNVHVTDQGVEFDLLAHALPIVLPKEARAALTLVPWDREFNQETLAVRGLPPGMFRLAIEGRAVGDYSAQQLADGINLAGNPKTPQYQQSAVAAGICAVRSDIGKALRHVATFRYARAKQDKDPFDDAELKEQLLEWLGEQVDNPPSTRRAESIFPICIQDLLDEGLTEQLFDRLGTELRTVCRPKTHHYRLTPVSKPAGSR